MMNQETLHTPALYKYQLAYLYGVHTQTISSWLNTGSLKDQLDMTGIKWQGKKLLPPKLVNIIIAHLGTPEKDFQELSS